MTRHLSSTTLQVHTLGIRRSGAQRCFMQGRGSQEPSAGPIWPSRKPESRTGAVGQALASGEGVLSPGGKRNPGPSLRVRADAPTQRNSTQAGRKPQLAGILAAQTSRSTMRRDQATHRDSPTQPACFPTAGLSALSVLANSPSKTGPPWLGQASVQGTPQREGVAPSVCPQSKTCDAVHRATWG